MGHLRLTSICCALLTCAGLLALTGCNVTVSPTGPNPSLAISTNPCPSWEEACEQIGAIVGAACGAEEDHENHGQWTSCRSHRVDAELAVLVDCFTQGEIDSMRGCALAWAPEATGDGQTGGAKNRPHSR